MDDIHSKVDRLIQNNDVNDGHRLKRWHIFLLFIVMASLGSVMAIPFFQRKEGDFDAQKHLVDELDKNILDVGGGVIINDSITWSNQYGALTVTPHTCTNIIRQTQYAEFVSNITADVDIAFRFNNSLDKKDIWFWKNISHNVSVPDYGNISTNYTLYNILDIIVINESVANETGLDHGDIPSDYYRKGNGSYWTGVDWINKTFYIGFDSFEWLNPEHTNATFYYTYWGIIGYHIEQRYWFDWKNIKHLFNHTVYNNKHYYYVTQWAVKNQTYNFKWQYNSPLVNMKSSGKWDLMAKLHNETIQEALASGHYVMIDPWWNSNWGYMKVCNINDSNNSYQMEVNVSYDNSLDGGENVTCDSHCQTDFDDIRFVDIDNSTELDYWLEEKVDSDYAVFWVETPTDVETDTRILMYYGNVGVSTTSNANNTFIFYDDFEDGAINSNKWAESGYKGSDGSATETGGYLNLTKDSSGTGGAYIRSNSSYMTLTNNFRWEFRMYADDYDDGSVERIMQTFGNGSICGGTGGDSNYYAIQTVDSYVWAHIQDATGKSRYREVAGGSVADLGLKFDEQVDDEWENVTIDYLAPDGYFVITVSGAVADSGRYDTTGLNSTKDILFAKCAYNNVGDGGYVLYDWVRIRKYLNTSRPYWASFGSEQSAPGWSNSCPSIDNEHPVNTTIDVARYINGSVIVWDADGNSSLVTWWNNKTGSWVKFQQNNSIVANGTTTCSNFTFANVQSTKYWWRVYAYDGHCNSSVIFEFTTIANVSGKAWQQTFTNNFSYSNTTIDRQVFTNNFSYSNSASLHQAFSNNFSYSNSATIHQAFTNNFSYSNTTIDRQVFTDNFSYSNTSVLNWQQTFTNNFSYSNTSEVWHQEFTNNFSYSNTAEIWQQIFTNNFSYSNDSVPIAWNQEFTNNFSYSNSTPPLFTITNEYPTNQSNIYVTQPTVYFNLTHPNGYTMNYSLYIHNTTLVYTGNNVTNGTQVNVDHLFYSANTTYVDYFWRVEADDGTDWVNQTFNFQAVLQGGGGITGYGAALAIATGAIMLSVVGLIGINEKKKRRGRI